MKHTHTNTHKHIYILRLLHAYLDSLKFSGLKAVVFYSKSHNHEQLQYKYIVDCLFWLHSSQKCRHRHPNTVGLKLLPQGHTLNHNTYTVSTY